VLYFATYFDARYLSRGLSLLSSLRQRSKNQFILHILCLDDTTYQFFKKRNWRDVNPIPLSTLYAEDTELAEVSETRHGADMIFTLTPSLIGFIFDHFPKTDFITYLDADIFFFEDPQLILDEIGSSSIAIIKHRFSWRNYTLRDYGIFNVGWVSWRRDLQGLKCLHDYRKDCLNWCHDFIDGCNYADQRYLDRWPSLYQNLCIISHKGANVAPWNLDLRPISVEDGKTYIGGEPLIFYHFHKFSIDTNGQYHANLDSYIKPDSGVETALLEAIYAPYAKIVGRLTNQEATVDTGVRHTKEDIIKHPKSDLPALEVFNETSHKNEGLDTYGMIEFLTDGHKTLKRQTSIKAAFGESKSQKNRYLTLAAMLTAGMTHPNCNHNQTKVLDWGISIGNLALTMNHYLKLHTLDFITCSLPTLVTAGKDLNVPCKWQSMKELSPLPIAEEVFDIIISASSLHYAENWQGCLASLLQGSRTIVGLYDIAFVSSVPSFKMFERMYNDKRETSNAAWAINIVELETLAKEHGFNIDTEFPSLGVRFCKASVEQPEYRSLLLRRN